MRQGVFVSRYGFKSECQRHVGLLGYDQYIYFPAWNAKSNHMSIEIVVTNDCFDQAL